GRAQGRLRRRRGERRPGPGGGGRRTGGRGRLGRGDRERGRGADRRRPARRGQRHRPVAGDDEQHPPEPGLGLRLQHPADTGGGGAAATRLRSDAVAHARGGGHGPVQRGAERPAPAPARLQTPYRQREGSRAMNIGKAAEATGVSAKMIRYYEAQGLIRPADRTEGNYRDFSERDLNDLRFIRRARGLGFSIEEISRLLSLWRDEARPSREVKAMAQKHLEDLDARIREMREMADTLRHLAQWCAGDERPDCPILSDLAGGSAGQQ